MDMFNNSNRRSMFEEFRDFMLFNKEFSEYQDKLKKEAEEKAKGGDKDKKKDEKKPSTFTVAELMLILIGTAPITGFLSAYGFLYVAHSYTEAMRALLAK